jgi:predicted O-methyltransferase YrrM
MDFLNTNKIVGLYGKYKDELLEVGQKIRSFLDENHKKGMNPQLSDIEAELTYMFLRELKPNNVVEFSPCHGYSSMWILNAMDRNNNGTLFSFDLIDDSEHYLPKDLNKRRVFVKGDVTLQIKKFPEQIDYLFIDSDHSQKFGQWYIRTVFPLINSGTYVSVHDVAKRHPASKKLVYGEAREIVKWLDKKNIPFYSASLKWDIGDMNVSDPNAREVIDIYKKSEKFDEVNVYGKCQRNSAIFFIMEK